MLIRDNSTQYGLVSRGLHWGMAGAILALFVLGWWMVGLDYYDPYYTRMPAIHRSVGMIVLLALLLRISWRLANNKPVQPGLTSFERKAARSMHVTLYGLLLMVTFSGYLISTAEGRGIDVFGFGEIPSLISIRSFSNVIGDVHRWAAYTVVALSALHMVAALRHAVLCDAAADNGEEQSYQLER